MQSMADSESGSGGFRPSAEELASFDFKEALERSRDKIAKNALKMMRPTESFNLDQSQISDTTASKVAAIIMKDGIDCTPQQAKGIMAFFIRSGTKCKNCKESETFRQTFQPDFRMKRCARCRKVFYCDEICQRKDWKIHKLICKQTGQEDADLQLFISAHEDAKTFGLLDMMRNIQL